MNMRNATCVTTQTSKVPTQVTLLFIFYSVTIILHRATSDTPDEDTELECRNVDRECNSIEF